MVRSDILSLTFDSWKENPDRCKQLEAVYHSLKTHAEKGKLLHMYLENPDFDSPIYEETYAFITKSTSRIGGTWIPEPELKTILKGMFKTAMKKGGMKSAS